jgi:hypothetical protein
MLPTPTSMFGFSTLGIRRDAFGNVISLSPYFLEADFFLEDVTTLWES